jgi:hypothetical protein
MCTTKLKFIISHLKKAIYNLERAKDLDNKSVTDTTILALKEQLLCYQVELRKEI